MNLDKHKEFIKQISDAYTKELYLYLRINKCKGSGDRICFINGLLSYTHLHSFYTLDGRCDGCIYCEGNYCNLMRVLK